MQMSRKEVFVKTVFGVASELKIPLVDELVYDRVTIDESRAATSVTFAYDDDESVVRGFLGLAQYYRSIVIKKGDKFFIPVSDMLFRLELKQKT